MEIARILVCPVKSLGGIEVQESYVDQYGFQYDRMYALVHTAKDGSYSVLTQRQEPSLARVKVALDGPHVVMSHSDDGSHHEARLPLDLAELPSDMPRIDVPFLAGDMVCYDVGAVRPELREFFAGFLAGTKYTGVTVAASDVRRKVRSMGAETDAFIQESGRTFENSFQDYYPGTLMTTASCEELLQRVEMTGDPIDAGGFRMNLLVRTDEPWVEDDWRRIKIGGHEWFVDSLCERCATTLVDQSRGVTWPKKQPLTALGQFRVMNKGRPPCFGLNLYSKDQNFDIRVGDTVDIIETSA